MKRWFFRSLTVFAAGVLCTVPAWAAELLIPVGEVVGLSLSEGSVTVAAFHETCGAAARDAGIEVGDEIISVDGRTVDTAADLYEALKCSDGSVTVELSRGGKRCQVHLSPAVTADGPRLGVYVRERVTGIGTVTYYDPDDGTFGALGHGISDNRGSLAPMRSGWVYEAAVESVKRGKAGEPGQLRGAVESQTPLGSLRANTTFGVFGSGAEWTGEALPVAEPGEVCPGGVKILSNVQGDTVELFDAEILKCTHRESPGRDLLLKITDPRLLEATGGIVAGMSGSPIIQDGKLVGAVTHVLVNDPTRGYGIFIENMLEAAEQKE
jgi:stage IV sporulation protein B